MGSFLVFQFWRFLKYIWMIIINVGRVPNSLLGRTAKGRKL